MGGSDIAGVASGPWLGLLACNMDLQPMVLRSLGRSRPAVRLIRKEGKVMSFIALVVLVAFCGVVGTYLVLLGMFPPVPQKSRVARTLGHIEHMRVRSHYSKQDWQVWTGEQ